MRIHQGWYQGETGKVFGVKITTDSGRVLAIARVEAALQPGYTLEERIGDGAVREIESTILRAAEEVARGVEMPPRKEGANA